MRVNRPCNVDEYELPEGCVIITHTDLQSRITYANDAFVESSGFTRDECMGEPQNLVRHPDMPPAAFRDMWRTIKAGNAWTGIVKNRRKSGGFYWVRAYVSPRVEAGRKVGYLSVRVKPTAAEVRAADALYAAMRAGRASHVTLDGGRVIDRSFGGWFARLRNAPFAIVGGMLLGAAAVVAIMTALREYSAGAEPWRVYAPLACAAFVLAAFVLSRMKITRPVAAFSATARRMMEGDASARFATTGDATTKQLGAQLNQLGAKLTGVMTEARTAAESMVEGVSEIVAANEELADQASNAAASLEETAASIEQLTATVARNTESVQSATELAQQASSVTERSGVVVAEAVQTMSHIASSSQKITEIVGLIDSITFQTNLLALNAAVEAARAGDHGRGFAVVAQEVRALAERAGTASKSIRQLVTASIEAVERGTQLVGDAQRTMTEAVQAVDKVAQVVVEIGSAGREQVLGIDQISKAVAQLDQIGQQNAHRAQTVAETAERLNAQAKQMLQVVTAFALKDDAGPATLPALAADRAAAPAASTPAPSARVARAA